MVSKAFSYWMGYHGNFIVLVLSGVAESLIVEYVIFES